MQEQHRPDLSWQRNNSMRSGLHPSYLERMCPRSSADFGRNATPDPAPARDMRHPNRRFGVIQDLPVGDLRDEGRDWQQPNASERNEDPFLTPSASPDGIAPCLLPARSTWKVLPSDSLDRDSIAQRLPILAEREEGSNREWNGCRSERG